MVKTVHGVVHGRTIQLEDDLGLAEGERVEVRVQTVQPASSWGDGIRRSAGGWAATQRWTRLWRGFSESENSSVGRKSKTHEPSIRYEHLRGAFRRPAGLAHRFI
jgi:hypothetical protein